MNWTGKHMGFGAAALLMIAAMLVQLPVSVWGSQAQEKEGVHKVPQSLIMLQEGGYAILVEKSTQRLYLYSKKEAGYHQERVFPCSTGETAGRKRVAGDKKTPEGVYFFTDEYEDKDLAPVYGKKAFPTDYPNFLDTRFGRNGSAIWLHGTNRDLKPMDSNGCVAMNNDDIMSLEPYISLGNTPIIISDTIAYADAQSLDQERENLVSLIKQWRGALESGSYHDYLKFYADDYLPEIRWWMEWMGLRDTLKAQGIVFTIETDVAGLYREADFRVAVFSLRLTFQDKSFDIGKRQLFIKADTSSRYAIAGDIYVSKGEEPGVEPVVLVARKHLKTMDVERNSVMAMVEAWMKAWSSKAMEAYGSYYAQSFYSDDMNKSQWLARKKMLAAKYHTITVTGDNYQVQEGPDKSVVTFSQDYRSNSFRATGIKTLELVREGGGWKIFRENWKMN
ncbi:MAG: L,D-transpeptidase family protein [Pseudomonadota bacterium]